MSDTPLTPGPGPLAPAGEARRTQHLPPTPTPNPLSEAAHV